MYYPSEESMLQDYPSILPIPIRILCGIENEEQQQRLVEYLQRILLTLEIIEAVHWSAAIASVQPGYYHCLILKDDEFVATELLTNLPYVLPIIVIYDQPPASHVSSFVLQSEILDQLSWDELTPALLQRSIQYGLTLAKIKQDQVIVRESDRRQYKQHLPEQERYYLTLEGTHEGIWDWFVEQPEIYGNDRLWQLLGLSPQERPLTVDMARALVHPQDLPRLQNIIATSLESQGKFHLEIRLLYQNQEYRDFEIRGQVQTDSQGKVVRRSGILTDITEQKRSEERTRFLIQSSSLLSASPESRTTLENLAWLAVPKIADWCIFEMQRSPQVDRYVAIKHRDPSQDELLETFSQFLFHRQTRRNLSIQFDYYLNDRHLAQLAAEQDWPLDLLQQLNLRAYIWVPLHIGDRCFGSIFLAWGDSWKNVVPADFELAQELAYRTAWTLENSRLYDERQLAYANLEEQQQRLQTLQTLTNLINQRLSDIPDLLNIIVKQLCVDLPLAEVAWITLFNAQDPCPVLVIIAGENSDRIDLSPLWLASDSWLHQVYEQGTPQLYSHRTSPSLPSAMAAVSIHSGESGQIGVLGIGNWQTPNAFDAEDCQFLAAVSEQAAIAIDNARLITTLEQQNQALARQNQALENQQRQIEQQNKALIEASRVKDLFLATISHELRTPMNAILGFSQVLLRQRHDSLQDKQKQIVERILNNGRSLLILINDILDFSQIKLAKLQIHPSRFNIVELIEQIIIDLQPLAEDKNLHLYFHDRLTDPLIVHDQKRIRQIIINLVANALRFTHEGEVEVSLDSPHPETIRLTVRDTGIGIAPEHLDDIFNEFWQVRQDLNRSYGGTGLGLAITRSLVELMQGKISVVSNIHEGTTFTVQLPQQVHLYQLDPEV